MTSRSADRRHREPLPSSRADEASRSERLSRLATWFEDPGSEVLNWDALRTSKQKAWPIPESAPAVRGDR